MIWGYYYVVESDARGVLPNAGMKELPGLCEGVVVDTLAHPGDELTARKRLFADLGEGDVLVVPNLARFAQDLDDLLRAAAALERQGASLRCLDDGHGKSVDGSEGMPRILSSVAAFQRRIAAAQSKRAAVQVRARGRNGGRPRVSQSAMARALKLYERNEMSIQEIVEATGISKSSLYKYLNEEREKRQALDEDAAKGSPAP